MVFFEIIGKRIAYRTLEELRLKLEALLLEIQSQRTEAEGRWADLRLREAALRKMLSHLSPAARPVGACHE